MKNVDNPCSEMLKRNCEGCDNSIEVDGDYCHTLRGYQQGRADAVNEFVKHIYEYLGIAESTKYDNKTVKQQHKSYDTYLCYEIKDAIDDVAEQIKEKKK